MSALESEPSDVTVGCMCNVKVREGRKITLYKAKVLGIGKLTIAICVCL